MNKTIWSRRERTNGGLIEPLPPVAPVLTLDMMPREPHLLDYLMILRKHQWLIVSFLAGGRNHRDDRHLRAAARLRGDHAHRNRPREHQILPFNGPDASVRRLR